MVNYPDTVSEFVSNFRLKKTDYVGDIVVDDRKKYGLIVKGFLVVDGNEISISGSVHLDMSSGDPLCTEGTRIRVHGNPNHTSKVLFKDEKAIEVMKQLCKKDGNKEPFVSHINVDIDNLAL